MRKLRVYDPQAPADATTIAREAAKFHVVLFGAGKTLFAPPNQPSLQLLLQYRNMYERLLAVAAERPDDLAVYDRAVRLLDCMWKIVYGCMRESNRSKEAQAKLIQAQHIAEARFNPLATLVRNPAYPTTQQGAEQAGDGELVTHNPYLAEPDPDPLDPLVVED